MSRKIALDQYDYGILEILQKDATISNKELAKQIGLSPPATLVRVNHLKEKKYLHEAAYSVNWSKLGFDSHIHIYCVIKRENRDEFLKLIDSFPRVLASYELRKSDDFNVDYWHYRFILFAVFKDQHEWHKCWQDKILETGIIEEFRALRVLEVRRSKLPVPLFG